MRLKYVYRPMFLTWATKKILNMEKNCKEYQNRNIRFGKYCLLNLTLNFIVVLIVILFFLKPSHHQQPQDDQQWLLTCISQYLGFSGSKPVAALLIYQRLLHWKSFEAMKTGVFDSILHAINSATEVPAT